MNIVDLPKDILTLIVKILIQDTKFNTLDQLTRTCKAFYDLRGYVLSNFHNLMSRLVPEYENIDKICMTKISRSMIKTLNSYHFIIRNVKDNGYSITLIHKSHDNTEDVRRINNFSRILYMARHARNTASIIIKLMPSKNIDLTWVHYICKSLDQITISGYDRSQALLNYVPDVERTRIKTIYLVTHNSPVYELMLSLPKTNRLIIKSNIIPREQKELNLRAGFTINVKKY